MNETLKIDDVAIEYRVPATKTGQYNRMVYICPECNNDMMEINFDFAVGFASVPPAVVMVVECNNCGERYHCHAGQSTYRTFLQVKKRLAYQKAHLTKPESQKNVG